MFVSMLARSSMMWLLPFTLLLLYDRLSVHKHLSKDHTDSLLNARVLADLAATPTCRTAALAFEACRGLRWSVEASGIPGRHTVAMKGVGALVWLQKSEREKPHYCRTNQHALT